MPRWERQVLIREIWPALSRQRHVSTRVQCVSLLCSWMSVQPAKTYLPMTYFNFLYIPITRPSSRRPTATLTQQTCVCCKHTVTEFYLVALLGNKVWKQPRASEVHAVLQYRPLTPQPLQTDLLGQKKKKKERMCMGGLYGYMHMWGVCFLYW